MRYRARVPSSHAPQAPESGEPGGTGDPAGRIRRARRATARGLRRATNPSVIRGTAIEVAWTATHVVTYPLGVLEEQVRHPEERLNLDGLDPIKRGLIIGDVENAGTPIILIHGVVDNRSVFAMLKRGLRRRGFGRIITLNYSPLTDDVRVVAGRLEALVEAVCIETGYERVHVIGHSMGGLVARYFVQRMGGDSRVHTLVTLGTPHQGTAPATLVPHPVARQMRPGSDIMTELAAPSPGCRTRFVAIWSDLDQMIIPKSNARIEHAGPQRAQRVRGLRGPQLAAGRRSGRARDLHDAGPRRPGRVDGRGGGHVDRQRPQPPGRPAHPRALTRSAATHRPRRTRAPVGDRRAGSLWPSPTRGGPRTGRSPSATPAAAGRTAACGSPGATAGSRTTRRRARPHAGSSQRHPIHSIRLRVSAPISRGCTSNDRSASPDPSHWACHSSRGWQPRAEHVALCGHLQRRARTAPDRLVHPHPARRAG